MKRARFHTKRNPRKVKLMRRDRTPCPACDGVGEIPDIHAGQMIDYGLSSPSMICPQCGGKGDLPEDK